MSCGWSLPVADFAFGRTLKKLSSMFGDAQSVARKSVGVFMRTIGRLEGFTQFASTPLGLGLLVAGLGLVMWTALSVFGGLASDESAFRLREAWDTAAYFYFGIPAMALAVGVAAFMRPEQAWRWPLWLVAGHQTGVLLVGLGMQSGLSLILLTLILAVLLTAFFFVPALIGAMAARWLAEQAY